LGSRYNHPGEVSVQARVFTIETELESEGRWIAEVLEVRGALVYGETREAAIHKAMALALRILADQIEHGEAGPALLDSVFCVAA
jgi:predicted RNase H-like HicB family nuclease